MLTYLAVVSPPDDRSAFLVEDVVVRSDLARGDTLAPPGDIDVPQVIEHALRHLAWLTVDDPAIATALAGWTTTLAAYEPEPFRAFGGPRG